jgi:hypothetical protein
MPLLCKRRLSPLEAIAYHEAGHAISSLLHEVALRRVHIVADEDTLGKTIGRSVTKAFGDAVDTGFLALEPPRVWRKLEAYIMVLIAGILAERMATGRWNHRGACHDTHVVIDLMSRFQESPDAESAHFFWLAVRTRDELQRWWWRVEAIADALVERRSLSRAEIGAVMEAFLNSILAARRRNKL